MESHLPYPFTHISLFLHIGTFKELGAPDLCHIIKVNVKPAVKEVAP